MCLTVLGIQKNNMNYYYFLCKVCLYLYMFILFTALIMADYFEEMGWEPLGQGQAPNHLLHLARLFRDFGIWERFQEGQKLPPPASKSSVSNLEEKKVTASGKHICLHKILDFIS